MDESSKQDEQAETAQATAVADATKPKLSLWKVLVPVLVVAAIVTGVAYWYESYEVPHQRAVDAFNAAVQGLDERNSQLDEAVKGIQEVQASDVSPLDPATDEAASAAIAAAQAARQTAPQMPDSTEDILAATAQVEAMGDYTSQLADIQTAQDNLQTSIMQMEQVTNPTEAFVVQRLTGLPNITGVEAVTEDNDVNGGLNKAGGYTAAVYFTSDLVDQSEVYASEGYTGIPALGNDAGGCVEVFADEDDANTRNDYLAAFDGVSMFSPGSHEVFGTCVIRTSKLLTASQQQALTSEIEESLSRLE